MAKKKETILTPEERLKQALIPEAEQPYSVPGNWQWVKVGSVCDFERGITFPASAKEFQSTGENIPCLRTANIQEEVKLDDLIYVHQSYMKKNPAKLVQAHDIIMSSANSRELVGKTAYVHEVSFPMTFGGFVLMIRAKQTLSKYLFYYLQLEFLSGNFMGESTQTTNIANINTSVLGNYSFPLPPICEQQRIVACIENLFFKLDAAKEKLQTVIDGFELRKSAILHRAFTGELTEQWRTEHGVGLESWKNAKLGDFAESQYGYTESAVKEPIGPKFLRITDIQDGEVIWEKVPYCTISSENFVKYAVHVNDIMIARIGATTGKSYFVTDTVNAVFASYLIRLTIKRRELFPAYLYEFMQSQSYWQQITEFSAGIAQPGVNAKKLKEMRLPIPTVDEQKEIAFVIDSFLRKERQAKIAAQSALVQIDAMKKAILARAFRGELGTNDPTEESAKELVKAWASI